MPSALTRLANDGFVVEGQAAVDPVGGGDADPDGEVGGEGGADGADDFEGEARAVGEAAAVLVGAGVGEGREEFVGEVAVGGVDFGEEEAGGGGAVGGGGEVGDDFVHAGAVEGSWGRGYSSWKRRAEGATTLVQPPSSGVRV